MANIDIIAAYCPLSLLKSKSLDISSNEDRIKSKTQAMEDEKKELKEFEKAMNRSKISRKDSDSDSMGLPKDRASGGSATSDQPTSPKGRSVKRTSVRDLKALKKEKLVSSLPADDSRVQTQKPAVVPSMKNSCFSPPRFSNGHVTKLLT